ncbi:MAG TPA: DUF2723 domain-containing protein, partial [Polyangiales bacterium]|nr:DUF2723 domain-containing protein [Polyangiales bacterium]
MRGPVDSIEPRIGVSTLGVPLRARAATWLATCTLALYYCFSMARDLSLYDSGELALAAVQLGLAHPPGQPLHTLLGFALSHLPGVSALLGVNLASALPAALTLIPATSLGQRLLGETATPAALRCMPWLLAIWAVHPCLWEPATRVEVYALATLGAVFALALAAELPSLRSAPSLRRRRLQSLRVGLALGLCASANPVIALATALALAGLVGREVRASFSLAGWLILGGLIGLLPYAYLPFVAGRTDVLVWGAPHDFASYGDYLLLRDYAHNQGITLGVWLSHLGEWLEWAGTQGLWPVLGVGAFAYLHLGRSNVGAMTVSLQCTLLLSAIAANVVWHVEIPDYNGYMAAPLWALGAGTFALCLRPGRRRQPQIAWSGLAIACAACALIALPAPYARTRSIDELARTLAERVLDEAPRGALVIAETDALAGALLYLQGAERARADVSVLVFGLASSSWHWQALARAHPELRSFALQGPGGRAARVRRWLTANSERPVLIERWQTARDIGLTVCPGGLYLRGGAACRTPQPQAPAAAQLIAAQVGMLGDGSPGAAGALAQ